MAYPSPAPVDLASRHDSNRAGELIAQMIRQYLQRLFLPRLASILGAHWHGHSVGRRP